MTPRWRGAMVRQAEGGAEGAAPAGEGTASPAADAAAAPPPFLLSAAERPDWLEESFYDPAGKGIRVDALGQSYKELRGKFSQKLDALRAEVVAGLREGVPAEPAGYALAVPEGALPEGYEAQLPAEDDHLVTEARAVLHELGAKPEQWQRLVGALVKSQIASLPDAKAEKAKLGEGADQRIGAVDAWLAKQLPEAEYQAFAGSLVTAAGVAGIERLMRLAGAEPGITGGQAGGGGGAIAPAEARAAIADKDYYHPDRGRDLRAKVERFIAAGGSIRG
jgi:hypothetical protein